MSPDEYLERAEHFRKAADEMNVGSFARFHLQTMDAGGERSCFA